MEQLCVPFEHSLWNCGDFWVVVQVEVLCGCFIAGRFHEVFVLFAEKSCAY